MNQSLGWCSYCRSSLQVRADGNVRAHKMPMLAPAETKRTHPFRCPGTGKPPFYYPHELNGTAAGPRPAQIPGQTTILDHTPS